MKNFILYHIKEASGFLKTIGLIIAGWLVILAVVLFFGIMAVGCTAADPGFVAVTEFQGNPLEVKIVDDDGDIIIIDEETRALVSLDFDHHQVHEGVSFSTWYEQEVSDTGDKTIIAFKTSNSNIDLNVIILFHASVSADACVLESPAIVDNTGATLAIYNRLRNSATTSFVIDTSTNPDTAGQAMFFTEVTQGNVTGGTEIAHGHLSAGEGKKALGGSSRGQQEWILKPNTLYAFVLESLNNEDNTHSIELNWYEHTDLNGD